MRNIKKGRYRKLFISVFYLGFLFFFLSTGCGGVPEVPLLNFSAKECSLSAKFPHLFKKKEAYGCLAVYWEGQSKNITPPNFPVVVKSDGTYLVYDKETDTFVSADKPISVTVDPGVSEVNVAVFIIDVLKGREEIKKFSCDNLVGARLNGCWNDKACKVVWYATNVPLNPEKGNGSCQICQRELCNGKDDDCDGQTDEDNACGYVLNSPCFYSKTIPKKPCDTNSPCQCAVVGGQVYVCWGVSNNQSWRALPGGIDRCTSGINELRFCGKDQLFCDKCNEGNSFVYKWSLNSQRCAILLEHRDKK